MLDIGSNDIQIDKYKKIEALYMIQVPFVMEIKLNIDTLKKRLPIST